MEKEMSDIEENQLYLNYNGCSEMRYFIYSHYSIWDFSQTENKQEFRNTIEDEGKAKI